MKSKDKIPEKIEETNRELFKFASGVAQAQRFFPEVQPAWKEFSKKTISEFADKINSLFAEDFKIDEEIRAPASATQSVTGRAYVYLCNARHLFAKNQSQMRPEKSIKYGRFAERYVTDSILFFRPKSWELLIYNAFANFFEDSPESAKSHLNEGDIQLKFDGEDALQFVYTVLLIENADSPYQLDSIFRVLVIHPSFPEEGEEREKHFEKQFAKADLIFQQCINWQPEDGHEAFLINIAKLCHFFAIFQPILSGNSAIVEWMIRGIAENKGLELGPFNWGELGWDLKAFVTPNVDDYVEWFVQSALPDFAPSSPKPG